MAKWLPPKKVQPLPEFDVFKLYDASPPVPQAFIRRYKPYVQSKESVVSAKASFYPNRNLTEALKNQIDQFQHDPMSVHFKTVMTGQGVIDMYNKIDNRQERVNKIRQKRWNKYGQKKPSERRPQTSKLQEVKNQSIRIRNKFKQQLKDKQLSVSNARQRPKTTALTVKTTNVEAIARENRKAVNLALSVTTRNDSPAEKRLSNIQAKRQTFPYPSLFKEY